MPENLIAVHWRANRYVKGCKIINAMTEEEVRAMQTGLSVDHFLELVAMIEVKGCKIINAMTEEEVRAMQTGISPDPIQFLELVAMIEVSSLCAA